VIVTAELKSYGAANATSYQEWNTVAEDDSQRGLVQ
jgi:hypothetical protein